MKRQIIIAVAVLLAGAAVTTYLLWDDPRQVALENSLTRLNDALVARDEPAVLAWFETYLTDDQTIHLSVEPPPLPDQPLHLPRLRKFGKPGFLQFMQQRLGQATSIEGAFAVESVTPGNGPNSWHALVTGRHYVNSQGIIPGMSVKQRYRLMNTCSVIFRVNEDDVITHFEELACQVQVRFLPNT